MYDKNAQMGLTKAVQSDDYTQRMSRTVEENIDAKIYALQQEIERLKASKESLKPLLNIRISDIQQAMSF